MRRLRTRPPSHLEVHTWIRRPRIHRWLSSKDHGQKRFVTRLARQCLETMGLSQVSTSIACNERKAEHGKDRPRLRHCPYLSFLVPLVQWLLYGHPRAYCTVHHVVCVIATRTHGCRRTSGFGSWSNFTEQSDGKSHGVGLSLAASRI